METLCNFLKCSIKQMLLLMPAAQCTHQVNGGVLLLLLPCCCWRLHRLL
jgi:hypothetical protein